VFFRYTPHNPIYQCLCSVAEFTISVVLLAWGLWTDHTVLCSALWCCCGIQDLCHTLAARGGVLEVQTATSSFVQGEVTLLQYGHLHHPRTVGARHPLHGRVTYTQSSSFFMKTFSASPPNHTVLLLQSHDSSCYVSRRSLAPPPL